MIETRPRNGVITEYNKPFIEQRADPYVYRHTDGCYYFTASVPDYDKIVLRRSDTLTGLQSAEEKTNTSRPLSSSCLQKTPLYSIPSMDI